MRKEQQILERIADFIHKTKPAHSRAATIAVITPFLAEGLQIPGGSVKQLLEEMLNHRDIMNDLEETEKTNRRTSPKLRRR